MNSIIYLVGLVVIVMAILSFIGLAKEPIRTEDRL